MKDAVRKHVLPHNSSFGDIFWIGGELLQTRKQAPSLEGKHPSKTCFFSQKEWRVGGVVRMNALGSFKGAFFLVHHHDYKYPWPGPGNRAVSAAHGLHCSQKKRGMPLLTCGAACY